MTVRRPLLSVGHLAAPFAHFLDRLFTHTRPYVVILHKTLLLRPPRPRLPPPPPSTMRSKSCSPIRVRLPLSVHYHAESIADLALEVCEEKLAATRRRKRPPPARLPQQENENPFLSKLGSPFVISRSIHGNRHNVNTNVNTNNIHPLKVPRTRRTLIPNSEPLTPRGAHQTSWDKLIRRLSLLDAPTYTLFLLFLTLMVLPRGIMTLQNRLFEWHALSHRSLNGRRCVLNLFIHKQKNDEFNPDLKFADPFLLDTYRTKGQMKIITRLIGCVADSFRNNLDVIQHVVFVGSRDGGHLAQEAVLHWPARGTHRTNLHVFADGDSLDSMGDENIEAMENRFTEYHEFIHLYDSKGNVAGTLENDPFDDDALPDKQKRIPETNLETGSFQNVLWDKDEEGVVPDVQTVIPYFHVDGASMAAQLAILNKAKPLLESHAITVLGLEHSPDMNINELINFFKSVNYKTFMLGLRQLSRIDNLCPEILENLMDHPSITHHNGIQLFGEKQPTTPPFFVAMPAGRHCLQEMTIQHMYDLFSGEGGGGQVQTAADRKAPKKK